VVMLLGLCRGCLDFWRLGIVSTCNQYLRLAIGGSLDYVSTTFWVNDPSSNCHRLMPGN
jgi:hypothetical protein